MSYISWLVEALSTVAGSGLAADMVPAAFGASEALSSTDFVG